MAKRNIYERLALTDEQKNVLREFESVYGRMLRAGLYLATSYGHGLYAYNHDDISCFDAPIDGSYDGGRVEVDITKLHLVAPFGMSNFTHLLNDTKCLVGLDDDD